MIMQVKENNWKEFYEDRVNSTYQDYFEDRYKIMLDIIKSFDPKYVREEGIGIGSISKALNKANIFTYGFDNNYHMLGLCQKNNPGIFVYDDCILNPKILDEGKDLYTDLVLTHGVLEHMGDKQISSIIDRYRKSRVKRIHYVPLDKYDSPSFGDERLLSYQHWLNLVKPKDYILFNDEYDLLLIN